MSIATAIQELINSKNTLDNVIQGLNTTKGQIKSAVNYDIETIGNEQIEAYPELIRANQEALKQYIPKITGEGKQLSLNTVPLKAKEFALIGDTFQQQYEGKNIIPTQVEKWEQGSIATADGTNITNTARIRTTDFYPVQEQIDYYVSVENTTYRFVNLFLYNSNKEYITNYYSIDTGISGTTGKLVNFPSGTAYYRAIIRKNNASVDIIPSEIEGAKPMITLGTTKTDYEPYVGGTASPNPNYKQDIQVVTGNQTVVKKGKNLYSGSDTVSQKHTYFLDCKIGETYVLSFKAKTTSRNRVFLRTTLDKTDPSSATDSAQVYVEDTETLNSYTLTLTSTINGYLFMSLAGGTATYTFEQIMLETGSTATTYEPYITPVELPLDLGNIKLCAKGTYKDVLFRNIPNNEFYNAELEEGSVYKKNVFEEYSVNNDLTNNSIIEHAVSLLTPVLNIAQDLNNAQLSAISYCNMLQTKVTNYSGLNGTTSSHKIRVNISTDYVTTYDEAKQLCADKGLQIIFVAETPTYTKITDETLLEQLEAIEQTNMNNGTTIIYAVNEEGLQPTLYVEAYKKVEE